MFYFGNDLEMNTTIYREEKIDGIDCFVKDTSIQLYGYYKENVRHGLVYDTSEMGTINPVETDRVKAVDFIKTLLIENMKWIKERKQKRAHVRGMHFRLSENGQLIFDSKRDLKEYWKLPDTVIEEVVNSLVFGNGKKTNLAFYECVGKWDSKGHHHPTHEIVKIKDGGWYKDLFRKLDDNTLWKYAPDKYSVWGFFPYHMEEDETLEIA